MISTGASGHREARHPADMGNENREGNKRPAQKGKDERDKHGTSEKFRWTSDIVVDGH